MGHVERPVLLLRKTVLARRLRKALRGLFKDGGRPNEFAAVKILLAAEVGTGVRLSAAETLWRSELWEVQTQGEHFERTMLPEEQAHLYVDGDSICIPPEAILPNEEEP